jgi:hypothetical protein
MQTPFLPTTTILLLLYFVGIPIQFSKSLPKRDVMMLANGRMFVTYDRGFWIRICFGVLISTVIAIQIYKFDFMSLSSSTLIGLGLSAIFTAFVSPKVETLKDAEEFG